MGSLNDAEREVAAQHVADQGGKDPAVRAAAEALYAFPNAYPKRDYVVTVDCPEFTCVCPMTDQPDYGRFTIEYVPGPKILELKSLKLYLGSFRNVGIFHETVTNVILEDLKAALEPRRITITGRYNARGGITTTVLASWPERG